MAIKIENASQQDAEQLIALLVECDGDFSPRLSQRVEPRSYISKLMDLGVVVVARQINKLAGFAAFYANDPNRELSFLSLILVDEDHRSHGVGRLLIQYWIEYCRQHGFETLTLEVNAENHDLVRWYQRQGFETIERHERSGHGALLMSMNL